eukprot:TRINITY_DN4081_c0_g1_i1.p1 TRINITY_DN4081_c0_g1~~TRINITY_DN4081_c0_g1_i1.p1  ORF type:complete len:536 (+),score=109.88 TRINITY_DN4081_c0_g1_i1:150-1757(+)
MPLGTSSASPSPSPSPATTATKLGEVTTHEATSLQSIKIAEFTHFQVQITVPEDKLGFLSTFLQEDFGYITKMQASLAWVLVFRVGVSQLAEVLKSLSAIGVGVYFGFLDVIPLWFSLPLFHTTHSAVAPSISSEPSSHNSSVSSPLSSNALCNSPSFPSSIVDPESTMSIPTLLEPFRTELGELLNGATKDNRDSVERYRNSRILFASLRYPNGEVFSPKYNSKSSPVSSPQQLSTPPILIPTIGTGSDKKIKRTHTPNNLEGVFRRFSVEVPKEDAPSDNAKPETPTTATTAVIGFDAPVVGFQPAPRSPLREGSTASGMSTVSASRPRSGEDSTKSLHSNTSSSSDSSTETKSSTVGSVERPTPPMNRQISDISSSGNSKGLLSPLDDQKKGNLMIRVFSEDGSSRTLQIKEDETTNSVIQKLMQKFGLPLTDIVKWKLHERVGTKFQRILADDELVGKLYYNWLSESEMPSLENQRRLVLKCESEDGSLEEHKLGMTTVFTELKSLPKKKESSSGSKEKKRGFLRKTKTGY